jgi:hypothetical protein
MRRQSAEFEEHDVLIIVCNHIPMRALLWTVALFALATSLDSSLYGGFYTQAFSRMISEIAVYAR